MSAMAATPEGRPEQVAPVVRPPWPALGAALVSFLTLGISARDVATMPLLALLLLAAWVFQARLENGRWPLWVVRAALFGAVLVMVNSKPGMVYPGYHIYDSRYVYPFGQLCGAELVIQCWKRRPAGGPLVLGALVLSSIVFTCATNTEDDRFIPYLAPAYFIFAGLALADSRGSKVRGLAVLLAALCVGGTVRYWMHSNRYELTEWAIKLLQRPNIGQTMGLSETPTLGSTRLTLGSSTRVLRLEGARAEMHLRALAFDTYARGAWGPLRNQRRIEPVAPASLRSAKAGRRLRVICLVEECRNLFAPLHCAGLVPAAGSRLQWDTELRAPIISEQAAPEPYSYDVMLSPDANHQGPCCVPLSEEARRRCLAVPGGTDRLNQRYPAVRELAQRIGGQLAGPRERIEAVVAHLWKNHEYSLTIEPGAEDPVANFILDGKDAHCEYFASAAVMLLRCLNVPSRYVTGYLAHEPAGPGKMVVRGRDAHAWAESWIDGVGWVTVEATPPAGRPQGMESVSLFVRAKEWLEDRWAGFAAWFSELNWMQVLGWGVAAAASCAVLIGFWRKAIQWWRRSKQLAASAAWVYPGTDEALRAVALRYEDFLRRLGVPCPAHRTWQEHVAALAQAVPSPQWGEGGALAPGEGAATDLSHPLTPRSLRSRRPSPHGGEGMAGAPAVSLPLDLGQAEAFLKQYNAARFGAPESGAAAQEAKALLDKLMSMQQGGVHN